MTDTPELPLGLPPPDDPDKPEGSDGGATDEQAAESASELVDAIDTLDHLLEARGETLLDEGADEDGCASQDVPLLLDVVRRSGEAATRPQIDETRQGSFEEMDDPPQAQAMANAGSESLQSQLIDELRQIIDDGLSRVAETTRAAVAQELKDQREVTPSLPTADKAGGPPPSEMRTLAQAVDDALEKCGIDLGSHEALYVDLLGELNAILRGGLELIRRNMEATVRNRLQTHAERTLRGLSQLRAEQQQELPWPSAAAEPPSLHPPTLEPYRDNGDNSGRSA